MVKTTIKSQKECREYAMTSIDLLRKRRWFAKPRAPFWAPKRGPTGIGNQQTMRYIQYISILYIYIYNQLVPMGYDKMCVYNIYIYM